MKIVVLIIVVLLCWTSNSFGQNWAGPDTTTCGELGVVIGSNDPCEGCCYIWSPTIGLSDHTIKNPTAKPTTETIYSVTVTDANLRLKGKDEVTVGLSFGEMFFSPDYLIQSSEESIVDAVLLNQVGVNSSADILWDILAPTLGCEIEPEGTGARITPGNFYGDIIVQASKVGTPGCIVKESLPVNNGVKDVWATDPEHTHRIAKTGETLYVISHEPVKIEAFPNPGGFAEGVPDWKPDTYGSNTPADGQSNIMISETIGLDDVISEYIAGDEPDFKPKVTVVRMPPQETDETTLTLPVIDDLLEGLGNLLKFKDQPAIDPPCGPLYPFSMTLTTPTIKFNEQIVEKYGTPRLSRKKELALEMELAVAGRLFHPVFTKSFTSKFFNVTLCSRLFIEATSNLAANIKIVKDPSLADSSFQAVNPEIVWGFGVGGGAEFAFQPPGYLVSAKAKISAGVKCTFTYESEKLQAKIKVSPAVTKVEAKIQSIGNMGQFEDLGWGLGNFSRELELIPAKEFGPYVVYNFQN